MADTVKDLVTNFLKTSGLNSSEVTPQQTTLSKGLEALLTARRAGDKAGMKKAQTSVTTALNAGSLSDKDLKKAKTAISQFITKHGKPEAKAKAKPAKFSMKVSIAKYAPDFKKAFSYAKKGDKKATDKAVDALHKSMASQGDIPKGMTLDQFYTDLGKLQSKFNDMRRAGNAKDADLSAQELKKFISKLKFPKARKRFNMSNHAKVLKAMHKIADAITRTGVTSSETLMYASEAILNYADLKKLKNEKTANKTLAQDIHDELNAELDAMADALI